MTGTLTIDDRGQIVLPEPLLLMFGAEPGARLRVEVTPDRIEIVKDAVLVTEGVVENGVLVVPRFGIKTNAAAAVRAERDDLADRSMVR